MFAPPPFLREFCICELIQPAKLAQAAAFPPAEGSTSPPLTIPSPPIAPWPHLRAAAERREGRPGGRPPAQRELCARGPGGLGAGQIQLEMCRIVAL